MKIAICPGSFDPVTKGHVDILERSSKLFDKVIAVVLVNPAKTPTFTTEERVELIKRVTKHIPNVEVESFTGLVADYAKLKNAHTLIKGLRAVTDFEYEFQQALINKRLNADIETLFMAADTEHMFLSSSMIKQVCLLGGDVSPFLPEEVSNEIIEKLQKG
jgi:pantetheine-phosphate adenylyltransferase